MKTPGFVKSPGHENANVQKIIENNLINYFIIFKYDGNMKYRITEEHALKIKKSPFSQVNNNTQTSRHVAVAR